MLLAETEKKKLLNMHQVHFSLAFCFLFFMVLFAYLGQSR